MAAATSTARSDKDLEKGDPEKISWFTTVFNQQVLTREVIEWKYEGHGTHESPYVVNWIDQDPRNPMLWPKWKKWALTQVVAIATLAVAFVSSGYSGGLDQVIVQFHTSEEIVILGISLFVLGFALGPLIWAPMSELYGRQYLFAGTYFMLTVFNAAAAGSQNIQTLIILRFFAGAFGSSPLTNAGGVIADIFPAADRGLAMSLFAAAPFLGPVIGPVVGGFVGETVGWRWVEGVMAIFTGVLWIIGIIVLPETYPPVLLRQRAKALSKLTGQVYKSKNDVAQGEVSAAHAFKTSLLRPWILLFREPIVLLLSIYMAIIYGTLYMMFAAFPIVYQEGRGWSAGVGGLAFLGIAVGMVAAVIYSIFDNQRYKRLMGKYDNGIVPPEARLPPAMIGGIAVTIGLFWFAWTNGPSIPWIVSVIASAPFGFGMVLIFLAVMNYLIDSYVIYAASVLAANAVLRSLFGAAFPLFTTYMFDNLGIHWASSVPAFLALACTPLPFLFYKFGPAIRAKCKFAAEAAAFMDNLRNGGAQKENPAQNTGSDMESTTADEGPMVKDQEKDFDTEHEHEEEMEQEAMDYSYDDEAHQPENSRFKSIRTQPAPGLLRTNTNLSTVSSRYDPSPFDIDRVNTRQSFSGRNSMTRSRNASATDVSISGRTRGSSLGRKANQVDIMGETSQNVAARAMGAPVVNGQSAARGQALAAPRPSQSESIASRPAPSIKGWEKQQKFY